jgi:hypothetical protein
LSELAIWNITTLAIARDSAHRFEVRPGEIEAATAMFFNYTIKSILFLLWPMIFTFGLVVFAPQLELLGISQKPIIKSLYWSVGTTYACDCFTFLTSKISFIYEHKEPLAMGLTMALGITIGIAIVGLIFH